MTIGLAVEGLILLGRFEGRSGNVNRGDAVAATREVKCETALISEDVHPIAVGIAGCSGIILSLVEKRARFLSGQGIEAERHSIQIKGGRSFVAGDDS